ncbi:PREDICTED: dynein light chain roadblock-type 2 [Drosophila arizonae]|uniref:Dynein light chain roadblock-type 2 n=1 Tax=Drosophila arizonae TaxID=7263 RepID=A0ABM1PN16_DROAR|nr:PREDICTED: dynein light chain roadblock-type 2 [Drosophila arizonae]
MADKRRQSVKQRGSIFTAVYEGDSFVQHFEKRGAREIIIMDATGKPLRSTVSQRRTFVYAAQLHPLAKMARNVVRDLDPANDVTFLRIRSETHEVHMSLNPEFIVVVIQKLKARKR